MEFRNRPCRVLLALLLASAVSANVDSADWRVTPRFSVSELYSDNINIQSNNEEGDFVTQVTPGISIRASGARLDLNADYNFQTLTYINDGSRDSTFHQLQSNLDLEAIRDRLFINAYAQVFQSLVSTNGTIGNDNARLSNNRDDIIAFGVSPTFKHHFGNWADFTATTGFNEVKRGGGRTGAGRGQNFNASLKSGSRFDRTRWSIRYSRRGTNNTNGSSSSSFQSVDSKASYRLNRFFSIDGKVGTEFNDFAAQRGRNNNGFTWSIGGTFTPNRRTTISGDIGERAFGSTRSFSLSHRRRRVTVNANYREELRTSNEELLQQQIIPLEDAFGNPVFNTDQISNLTLPIDTLSLVDEVFLTRNFDASIGYFRKRDTFSISVFMRDRDGQATESNEKTTGFNSSWNRSINRRFSGGLRFTFRTGNSNRFGTNQRNSSSQQFLQGSLGRFDSLGVVPNNNAVSDVYFVTPFLSYIIGPSISSNLSYTYTRSISDNLASNYIENSVTGALNFAF